MKIAITSDFHANINATNAVFDIVEKSDIDSILVAGDLIGYYFSPAEVIDRIRGSSLPTFIVKGNHEEMLIDALANDNIKKEISKKYGPGIDYAIRQLSCNTIEWIRQLEHPMSIELDGCRILLCHGSPNDINEYIYPDSDIASLLPLQKKYEIVVLGHTHYPFTYQIGSSIIVNPGSVGQPRNREPGAHWTLLDTTTMNIVHRITEYDMKPILNQCNVKAPNHKYLREVLERR